MLTITPTSLHRILVICVIVSILLATGCAAQPPQPETQPGAASSTQAAADQAEVQPAGDLAAGDDDAPLKVDELEVRFLEENYQAERYASEPLGNVTFSADDAAAVERELAPQHEALEMQVVDGAGLTWTLKIPAGALDIPETVRMVPLTGLDGSAIRESAGVVRGGVQLEPDGLAFSTPLELTVSGPGLEGPTLILSGDQQGARVDFTLQDVEASDPTARVLHFSTYFASPLPDPQIAAANQSAMQEFKRLEAIAKKLRRAPLEVPVPPSVALDCTDEKSNQAVEAFVENAMNPELDLAVQMLTQWRIVALTTQTDVAGIPELAIGMAMRLTRKATAMIKQYYGSEDKLLPVSIFALDAARKLALLGHGEPMVEELTQQVLSDLANWNAGLIDKLVNEIGKKHNYQRIPTALMVAYHAALLGNREKTNDFLEKLREVMRFEATITYSMQDPFIKARTTTEVVQVMQFEPAYGMVYRCYAEGTGKPLEAVVDEEGWAIQAVPYPVRISIEEFDPCMGTLTFYIDRFGSDQDTATFEGYSGPWNVSQLSAESLFEAETSEFGAFKFILPVQNGNKTMVDFTLDRTRDDNNVSGSLQIQIIHQ